MTQQTLFPIEPPAIRDLPGYPCAWSDDRKHRYTLWRVWGDGLLQFMDQIERLQQIPGDEA